jgi:hypothetical protein
VLGKPEPIAQRFAHTADLRQSALRAAEPSRASAREEPRAAPREATATAEGRSAARTRWLIAGLLVLIASVIAGSLWFGGSRSPESLSPEPLMPSAVLTIPDRIKAVAGESVSFPIALDGTDGVPSRSAIALRGLPQGSNFSEGRPYGESEWTLRPDQIGDLALVLPVSAKGEFKLAVALIAPDDSIVAEAETLLEIAPAPIRAEAAATEPGSSVAPEAGEATAAVPDDGEAAASAVAPEAGDEGAAPDEKPDSMETAATPSAEIPSESAAPAVEAASGGSQPNAEGQAEASKNALGTVQPSVLVNMRDAPSSSAPVLGVIAKGATLPVLDRKHGWVQVTDPESGKQGWIYRGLLVGEAKPDQRIRRVAPPDAEPKSESFWGRMGRWLTPG